MKPLQKKPLFKMICYVLPLGHNWYRKPFMKSHSNYIDLISRDFFSKRLVFDELSH